MVILVSYYRHNKNTDSLGDIMIKELYTKLINFTIVKILRQDILKVRFKTPIGIKNIISFTSIILIALIPSTGIQEVANG